ncbi:DUF5071 domain-containing protein, partial [Mycobacterium tuberculosis]|uniref:DUF5071 domain-containing protein n=1 Tax=Mycobacterium tuberculosis TaxID=1773 RepID=UPI0011153015
SDFETLNRLKACEKNVVRPLIPELFDWLQDINWPISSDLSDILLNFDDELIPHIRKVLQSDDGTWKYSILIKLVCKMSISNRVKLIPDLKKLSASKESYDLDEGLDELSMEILESINFKS